MISAISSISPAENKDTKNSRRDPGSTLSDSSAAAPKLPLTALWRTVAADRFDVEQLNAIQVYVAASAGSETLRAMASRAISGALRHRTATRIDAEFDSAMTELLVCAFKDAAAALVLSCMLRAAPLHHRKRARLATSWLAHNLKRAALKPVSRSGLAGDADHV